MTLFNVYECAINRNKLEATIKYGNEVLEQLKAKGAMKQFVVIEADTYLQYEGLSKIKWDSVAEEGALFGRMRAKWSSELAAILADGSIPYDIETDQPAADPELPRRLAQFEAVLRWCNNDWKQIDLKLRTSIVEGISVFLSMFDDDPDVKRLFCPPKECYDPVANAMELMARRCRRSRT